MDWIQIISTLGFPIACCIGLGWYVKALTDNYRKDIKEMRSENREDLEKTREVLQTNTLVLQKVVDKLSIEDDGKEIL